MWFNEISSPTMTEAEEKLNKENAALRLQVHLLENHLVNLQELCKSLMNDLAEASFDDH